MAGRPFGASDTLAVRSEANVDPFSTFVNNGMRWPASPNVRASGAPATMRPGTGPQDIASIMQRLSQMLAQRPRGLLGRGDAAGAGIPPATRPRSGGPGSALPAKPSTAFTGDGLAKLLQQMHSSFAQTGQTGDMPDIQQLQGGLRGHGGTLPPGFTFSGGNNNPIAQQILQMLRSAGG